MSKKIQPRNTETSVEEEFKTGPYKIIGEFFSAASLEHYRKYISSMLKAAYSEDYWRKRAPGSLLFFQEQMLELIKAAHLLISKGKKGIKKKKKALVDSSTFENGLDPSSYYGWHRESAIWEFFPRNLSKEEFLNPYKAYERFFEYKDFKTWIKEFKELVGYALEAFGNETAIDYDYLEIHRQLQKLVEASHLIEVRVIKSDRLKPNMDLLTQKTKTEENEELEEKETYEEPESYSNDPFTIIDQFFADGDVQDGRDDLNILLEAAFNDDILEKKHYPSRLIFAYERVEKLVDAAYTLIQEKAVDSGKQENNLKDKILDQVKTIYKKVKDWDLFPIGLKPIEWLKPRLALNAFFDHQPLSHWKGKLHELLQACIRDESFCSTISDRSKLYLDCDHLQRLIEAMWVIRLTEFEKEIGIF
jgi:hypothetical protein